MPGPGEVLIEVVASAVNRADLLQRMGLYPPPAGVTDTLGLECSGRIGGPRRRRRRLVGRRRGVLRCSPAVDRPSWRLAPAGQVHADPRRRRARRPPAALPEVAATVWSNVVQLAAARSAARRCSSTAAPAGSARWRSRSARPSAPRSITTAGSAEKARALPASSAPTSAINYRDEDFVAATMEATGRRRRRRDPRHRWGRRTSSATSTRSPPTAGWSSSGCRAAPDRRARPRVAADETRDACTRPRCGRGRCERRPRSAAAVVEGLWPLIAAGAVRPVVDATYPMDQVGEAHHLVADSEHVGKVLLTRADQDAPTSDARLRRLVEVWAFLSRCSILGSLVAWGRLHEVDAAPAGEAMFRLHYAPLAGWCRRMVGDNEVAHDIAAEAFVRLLGRWTTVTDPRAYLYTTALNLIRDRWRRSERERVALRKTATAVGERPRPRPSCGCSSRHCRGGCQQVVVLHYFADMSVDAVARAARGRSRHGQARPVRRPSASCRPCSRTRDEPGRRRPRQPAARPGRGTRRHRRTRGWQSPPSSSPQAGEGTARGSRRRCRRGRRDARGARRPRIK